MIKIPPEEGASFKPKLNPASDKLASRVGFILWHEEWISGLIIRFHGLSLSLGYLTITHQLATTARRAWISSGMGSCCQCN